MTPEQTAAVAVLRAAKREIETKGWAQTEGGGVEDNALPCCAYVAVNRVAGYPWGADVGAVIQAALYQSAKLGEPSRGWWGELTTWNDARGRDVAEVYAAFDRAVALIESGEVS